MASYTTNGVTWTYTYDANGMRTGRTDGTNTYEYIYAGDKLVRMIYNGAVSDITYAGSQPLTLTYDGETYYYVLNGQGDVIGLTDATGKMMIGYHYGAYGVAMALRSDPELAPILAQANPLLYRGYVYDRETRLYYLQSRYYDPELGRFINADTYASTGQGVLGNNMFAYCGNNPSKYSDSSGHSPNVLNAYMTKDGGLCAGGGGGIVIPLAEIGTRVLEGVAKIATWAVAASIYAYAHSFVDTSADRFADQQPRVHHIIPRGRFRWYGSTISGMMDEMHDMLEKANIDINDAENLIIVSHGSHKSMHTRSYIIQIYNIMKQAQGGDRNAVLEALDYARSYVASLDKYANGW